MMELLNIVRSFFVDNFLFGDESRMTGDISFLESGIVDSTGLLELVGFLEERFGIRIEDEELVPENMDSLEKISDYIARKLNRQTPGSLNTKAGAGCIIDGTN